MRQTNKYDVNSKAYVSSIVQDLFSILHGRPYSSKEAEEWTENIINSIDDSKTHTLESLPSAWKGHKEFAKFLVSILQPEVMVDLGTLALTPTLTLHPALTLTLTLT